MMSRANRLTLFFIGLVIILCSLLALGYVLWPLETGRITGTLAPTLFAPP